MKRYANTGGKGAKKTRRTTNRAKNKRDRDSATWHGLAVLCGMVAFHQVFAFFSGRNLARGPRAAWHDRATLVVAVLSCFGIVIQQFLFYLSSPSRIRRSLGFLGFSFCIVIELKIQEWIDLLLSIDRCYRFSTLFTLFFYALIRVSYCLACVRY